MAVLPYSRVVNVTLTRNDAFPSRRGFGTPLFLSTVAKTGKVDATSRTKAYASIDEVAADWSASDDFYKAAEVAFSQNPRPTQIKAGYVALDGTPTAAELKTELDALYAYDADWYVVTVASTLRDIASVDGLVEWIEANSKLAIIDSNDTGTENPANTTCLAARKKGTVERSAVFYHTSALQWPAMALAAYMATRVFDDAESAYTAKFKTLRGVNPVNLASDKITAITGFVSGVGQASASGHCANTYIDIGGRNFVVEGSTLTANVFLDEIHASDWIIARTEEAALGILLNNARVPFTDQGLQQIAGAARQVMQVATRAGLIAKDIDPETNEYRPAYEITVPSVFDVPESQRKARIAPAISVRFRYAGAVHYTTINYNMTF
ncbi:DUF3383 family protein [Gellertiella hungarica]|uniref:DUF3383 family protein n=1 Tax=Gellertiella hungarica TaxID=1572859 RepID=A0A7W6J2Q3_9HYPH|nr:DUF3383 family protein [Gellertiella hungarica]MBB4063686.1 hypothetical protein [Gellertiella hungarica]